jgi:hypothetical protein
MIAKSASSAAIWPLAMVFFLVGLACDGEGENGLEGSTDGSPSSSDAGPTTETFQLSDPNLASCVREAAGLNKNAEIRPEDLQALKQLECQARQIKSLDGLQHATSLEDLSLWENEIQSIEPLETLVNLTSLQLGGNQIADITPLAEMKSLKRLGLSLNQIDDLAPLKGLTELEWLNLDHNPIDKQDLSNLAGLKKLRWLTVEQPGSTLSTTSLGTLASAGCQVYAGLAKTADHLTRSGILLGNPLVDGKLVLLTDTAPDGRISFAYDVGGKRHRVLTEFPGEITLGADGKVRYRGLGREVVIGEKDGGLCKGRYSKHCQLALGRKVAEPGLKLRGEPVFTLSLTIEPRLAHTYDVASFSTDVDKDLIPYVFASPNQLDSGSCLFMANTGAMEILMNQLAGTSKMKYGGETDLSERFLMNASNHVPEDVAPYAITDVISTYNHFHGSLLSVDYPYTAGYVKELSNGSLVPASPGDDGAQFSCQYNWIDQLPHGWEHKLVETPEAARTLIFLDPQLDKNSIWRVGVANEDVVERIKWELRTKNAPVLVVYNHYLYWHTSIVVGYDDNYSTGGCPMVDSMVKYFKEQGATDAAAKVEAQIAKDDGCTRQGVFYVRDSIYDGEDEEPTYSYSSEYTFKKKYSKRIVLRSYNWVKYVGNHAYTVHRM